MAEEVKTNERLVKAMDDIAEEMEGISADYAKENPDDPIIKGEACDKLTALKEQFDAGMLQVGIEFKSIPEFREWKKQPKEQMLHNVEYAQNVQGDVRRHIRMSEQIMGKAEDYNPSDVFRTGKEHEVLLVRANPTPLTSSSLDNVQDAFLPDVIMYPRTRLSIADLMRTIPISSDAFQYRKQTGRTNAAEGTAEGAASAQSSQTWAWQTGTVYKNSHYEAVTEEILADYQQTQSIINEDLLFGLAEIKDEKLIHAAGTSNDITGILNTSGIQSHTITSGDSDLDTLRRMMTKVYTVGGGYNATAAIMCASDKEIIDLIKGSVGHYVWANPTAVNASQAWGIPIVQSEHMKDPDNSSIHYFLVGDFSKARIYQRSVAEVAVGTVDTQFLEGELSLRATERFGFVLPVPSCMVYYQSSVTGS